MAVRLKTSLFSVLFVSLAAVQAFANSTCLPTAEDPDVTDQATELRDTVSTSLKGDARNVRAGLSAQGFKCATTNEVSFAARGFRCTGRITGYTEPVEIYIPPTYEASQPHSVAYHFVGWTTQPGFDPFTPKNGDYGAYLTKSQKNAILVIPHSSGKDQTYTAELGTAAQAKSFFSNVERILSVAGSPTNDQTPIVLSGHSGAGVELAKLGKFGASGVLPQLRHLDGVGLFDCGYNRSDIPGLVAAADLMRAHQHEHFFGAYTPGAGTAAINQAILQELDREQPSPGEKIQIGADRDGTEHMAFMREYMSEFFSSALP